MVILTELQKCSTQVGEPLSTVSAGLHQSGPYDSSSTANTIPMVEHAVGVQVSSRDRKMNAAKHREVSAESIFHNLRRFIFKHNNDLKQTVKITLE